MRLNLIDADKRTRDEETRIRFMLEDMLTAIPAGTANSPAALIPLLIGRFSVPDVMANLDQVMHMRTAR